MYTYRQLIKLFTKKNVEKKNELKSIFFRLFSIFHLYRFRLDLVEEATVNAKHQILTRVFPLENPQGEEFFVQFSNEVCPQKKEPTPSRILPNSINLPSK